MSVLTAACIISDDGGTCSGRDSCMDGILVGDFSGRLCGDGFSSDCIKCNFSDDRYEVGDFQLCIGDDFVVAWCVYFDSLLGKDGTGPQDCDLPVGATITPIAVSMLNYVGEKNVAESRIASKILLTIAYGTGVGGLASPLGGAMNLVVVDYIQQLTGKEYMYSAWIIKFLPIMILLAISNIFFMIRDVGKTEELGGSREYFANEQRKMKRMSMEEKGLLGLFLLATALSFTRQLYQSFLPGLKPAYVFIICAILSFLLTDENGERLQAWKSVQSKVIWELIYIFAGGLALGTLINDSGAASAIGTAVSGMGLYGGLVTVLVIITLTLLLSDITSNTATAAIAIPIVISIIQGVGKDPIPYIYIATVGVNLSYMFPTSIRAIPVGYGLSPKYMLKEGWKISVLVILVMTAGCYALLKMGFLF